MAPRKRPAEDDSEDDDSNISSSPREDGSTSQPESSSRKRRRIADDSDTTPEQEHDRRNLQDLTDESDDEEDEVQATQAIRDKRNRNKDGENAPREYGVLQKVELINFMNHAAYEFNLGPLINFVCGKNGSGKSALLTAIIICLGGKASTTSRGTSLKKFIKEGCDRARIICTIKNEGDEAYMHEEFGDRIIVERHFSQSGSTGVSIKTASGRIYSQKRADLDPILDHCGLQMDNPLNVLTQDGAREFLHKAVPTDKYKFFLKGVQLEQLDQDYRIIDEQLFALNPRLERKKEDVTALEHEKDARVQQREMARKRDGLRARSRDIRRQIVWIQVQEQEDIVRTYDTQIEENRVNIAHIEAEVERKEQVHQQMVEASGATEAALNEATTARDRSTEERRELEDSYKEARDSYASAQQDQRIVKDALEANKKGIAKKQSEIEAEQRHLEEVNGDGPAQRQRQLAAAKKGAEDAKTAYEDHKGQRMALKQDSERKKTLITEKQTAKTKAEEHAAEIRSKLQDLRNNESQSWNAFRRGMEKLVRLIANETRWQHKPIGPLGKTVRLLDASWSRILEKALGRTLDAFIVFNQHDHNILNELKDEAHCDAEVARLGRNEFTLNEPDARFKTILRVLEIDNPHVQRHLVIQHYIEQHLLIEDQREATNTMYDNGPLRNVKGCYARDQLDKSRGMLLRYAEGGAPSQDPVTGSSGNPRMKTDQALLIAERQRALEEAQEQVGEATRLWQAARAEFVKAEQAIKRHDNRGGDLKLLSQNADDEVDRLKTEIEGDQIDSGKLNELENLLKEAREQMQLMENQFKDAVVNVDAKKGVMRERQRALADYDQTIQELTRAFESATKEHRAADTRRSRALMDKNASLTSLEDARSDLQRVIESRQSADESRERFTEVATAEYQYRIEVPEGATRESLTRKFDKLEAERRNFQRQLGYSIEEAEEAAIKAQKAYEQGQKDFDDLKESKEMLEASLRDRRARWLKFRRLITVRARVTFSTLLGKRGFRGQLLINHDKHLLDLRVEPDITKSSAAGRGAKTLSGGEKSFSQICMLLAMWEAMGSPIRCLDEFDVFMDAVNRKQSIGMIIDAARESAGKQYILISPGSKSDIPKADDVVALELKPPERGQQTLPETDPGFTRGA